MKRTTCIYWLALTFLPGWALADGQTTRVSVDSAGNQSNYGNVYSAISADGRYVVFTSSAYNLVPYDTNFTWDVFVHDLQTGQTTRVSVDSAGGQGNNNSAGRSITADGRYVAFASVADNLIAVDTNGRADIFVHDRQTGQTTRVSVDSGGGQGNNVSDFPAISADGRYVAFQSDADNLVTGDTNGRADIFVHDRQTGQTTRVSVDSGGGQGNDASKYPVISADGRYVAYQSDADNLVTGDTNDGTDVFVHDRQTGQTTRVSIKSQDEQASGGSFNPVISADGRFVGFSSWAENLVAGDSNWRSDIFVHDRQTGETTRVSVDSARGQSNNVSYYPAISADGRYMAFRSDADNLVIGDTNGRADIFVHDRQTGKTTRVSVDSADGQGNDASGYPYLSADGRYVAFTSSASNLVGDDTNGWSDIFIRDRLLQMQNQADISLVLSGPASVVKSSDAVYKFKVTNYGSFNASNTTLTSMISGKGKLKSIASGQGTCSRAAVQVCRLGTLGAGKSVTVTATVTINGKTTISATAQAAPQDNKPNNNTKTIITKLQ